MSAESSGAGAVTAGAAGMQASSGVDMAAPLPIEAPRLARRAVAVDGSILRDERGRQVLLRGFNAGGRAKMAPFVPFDFESGGLAAAADAYFAKLAALGANTVRLTFAWEALEPNAGTYDDAYLDRYETLLDAAHANGLGAIVDFHQDVFASPFCGDGFPLWALGDIPHGAPHYDCGFPFWSLPYFDPASDVSRAFDRLWTNQAGLADAMEAMWRHWAGALAAHPAVVGFEIINEPGSGSVPIETFESITLPAFLERMGGAIRAVAGGVALFNGGRAGDSLGQPNELVKPDLQGYVYAPHYYEAGIAIGLTDLDPARIRSEVLQTLAPARAWNVPVTLGEFGAQNANPAKGDFLRVVLDVLDEELAHATIWEASLSATTWNSEDFSVLTPQGDEQPWAQGCVRGYPRAVAGELVSFRWDADALQLSVHVANATADVTEIHVPARHVGEAPQIELEGARYRFLPERDLLLVVAEAGSEYRVQVGPTPGAPRSVP